MKIRYQLAASAVALTIASFSTAAMAQSTGSQDFEEEVIVVTGSRTTDVEGIKAPDATKAKSVLTQEFISRQNPGQTVLDTINQVPGVSFQNNDAYGSSGGTLSIRGFDASRISLTFDGIPLNDSGNYAIYSNQQIDPELIEEVNVNMGTTDVDSPTASAVGGTVNYRTMTPSEDFGVKLSGSAGDFNFYRIFGVVNTGVFTPFGTKAWFSASTTGNDNPFNNYGVVEKQQYNAKIYQPIGSNGDFIAVAGHYNENRNNFFGSLPLRWDTTRVVNLGTPPVATTVPRQVGPLAQNRFPMNNDEREYLINYPCFTDTPQAGVADAPSPSTGPNGAADPTGNYASCGTEFDRRYNPSNTGNIRGSSRFSFGDKLVLTVDPSYQYVKANGGGTVTGQEGAVRDINPAGGTATAAQCRTTPSSATNTCVSGYLGGVPYFGHDVNGDGDTLDTVTVLAPSQTQTRRYGVIAGLKYDIDDNNSIRVSYTLDHARHRQTGEVGLLQLNGEPLDVFPVNDPQLQANGSVLQKRDRLSYAILNQVAGEYRGNFLDEKLTVNLGVRAPFFKRDLTNYCFTSSAGGFVECTGQNATANTQIATLNPYTATPVTGGITITGWAPPQNRVFKFNKVLPNLGLRYKFTSEFSAFVSFAQGLSVPGTDSLYNAFYFPLGTANAKPKPETTNTFDLGVRYRTSKVQAQAGAFLTKFKNRLASAYDPELDQSVYRNLGNVDKWGFDGSIAFQPIPELALYAFGSYIKSEIKDNIAIGENLDGTTVYAPTAGKRESGSPTWSYGVTARVNVHPVEFGLTTKKTGPRYIFDTNEGTFTGAYIPLGAKACPTVLTCTTPTAPANAPVNIFPNKAPAYWLVNLDARLNLDFVGLGDKTFLQLNVYNLFDKFYVGGFGGGLNQSATYAKATGLATYGNPGFVQIGAPRTLSATLQFGF